MRSFVDRGPHMAELLGVLSEKQPENLYVKFLLDAFKGKMQAVIIAENDAENSSRTEPSSEPFISNELSNRELDVLMLLSQRLTNKEIAERLKISPITVKAHTASIYRKLDVHGRRQAAARAEQLGLLTESGV